MADMDTSLKLVCDEFEQQWKSGGRPDIAACLSRISKTHRSDLLCELIAIELWWRRHEMPAPGEDEYLSRFAADRSAVNQAFESFRQRTVAEEDNPQMPDGDETVTWPAPNALADEPTLVPGKNHNTVASGDRVKYFGDYELLEEIARGGMGVVFKARQVKLNRIVALKMILSGELASEEEVQRFKTEAEAAANLDHPGIVPIYEIGDHNDQHFFSMGFVEGQSLADLVKTSEGPLPPRKAAELLKKVAEAVAYAHQQGVIHRDLKPANVLLDTREEPKVTDFGLAKQVDSKSNLTLTGAVLGTPAFMPPEQASGELDKVGPLADVYSLGAVFYYLLTGRPPFQSANVMDTLAQVIEKEPVAPEVLNADVPKDLGTICKKCLQKNPQRRYDSSEALKADLTRWLNNEPIVARPVGSVERLVRWCQRKPAVATTCVLTILLLVTLGIGGPVMAYRQLKLRETADAETRRANDEAERAAKSEARAKFQLANARWDENRVDEAKVLLHEIPGGYRNNFEWRYCNRSFLGSDVTLYGHTGKVSSVSFSPDRQRIVSGSNDHTIKLWDAVSGEVIRTLKGHTGYVTSVSFSPDGQRIVSGSLDNTVKLWDAVGGEEIRTFDGHTDHVTSVTFSPDGQRIVSGSWDKTIKLWDAASGQEITTLKGHTSLVTSVNFSPAGQRIASASWDNTVKLWDAVSGEEITTLKGHGTVVYSVSFSPDGQRIVSGSLDNTVKLWDAVSSEEIRTLKGHTGYVSSVSFSPDGQRIVSGSDDHTIKLWDAVSGQEIRTLKGHTDKVSRVSFSLDGQRIVSGAEDKTIKLWDTVNGKEVTLKGIGTVINSISFSPDGQQIVSGSLDDTIRLCDAVSGEEIRTLNGHTGHVYSVSFSPDGQRIVSGSDDHTIKLWDAVSGEEIRTLKGHTDKVSSVSFSPDGQRILSGSHDHTIKLWDPVSGEGLTTLKGHGIGVYSVSFSPDGQRIVSGSRDHMIKLWDAVSGEEIRTLKGHTGYVSSVSFSPDGQRILSGSLDNTVKLWDAVSGGEITTLKGHADQVTSVSFSPDGQRIVSGSWDYTIKFWDTFSGKEITILKGHTDHVTSVSFSPDGERLVSGSKDHMIKLWDAVSGEEIRTLKGHTGYVSSVSFSSDGKRVYSSGLGEKFVWDSDTGGRLLDEEWVQESGQTRSPDGCWLAVPTGDSIGMVDLNFKYTPSEKAYRARKARPNLEWHWEEAFSASASQDAYVAAFHYGWLMSQQPDSRGAYQGLQLALSQLEEHQRERLPAVVKAAAGLPAPSP